MAKKTNQASKNKSRPSRGLGRGLSALMSDVAPAVTDGPVSQSQVQSDTHPSRSLQKTPYETSAAQFIPIERISRNPNQPRRHFDSVKLEDLSRSIAEKGVLQPILCRPVLAATKPGASQQSYQIVAGERRWQAAIKAGLHQLPVMVRELSDREVLEIGVVENVQRANLNPIEEAQAYKDLTEQFDRTQADIAKAVGKSRSYVTNMMRLLTLPNRAQDFLAQGKLSAGHARAIIAASDPAALAEMIVQNDLSVREAEAIMRRLKKGEPLRPRAKVKDADTRAIEKKLSEALGLEVDIKHKNPSGQLVIRYKTAEQLEGLIRRLPQGFK